MAFYLTVYWFEIFPKAIRQWILRQQTKDNDQQRHMQLNGEWKKVQQNNAPATLSHSNQFEQNKNAEKFQSKNGKQKQLPPIFFPRPFIFLVFNLLLFISVPISIQKES